ncbi:STAS domain-containing protein [Kitasatospora terrestris]|uniref:STAS domain-containing protein n=1 Tax=Kitasatospora terrestris TaxID=258051 RepID=A0ABP9D5F1_9ACTN
MTSQPHDAVPVFQGPDITAEITTATGTVVCAFAGALHADNEEHVRRALAQALNRRPALLVVHLASVDLFTSSALNMLLIARRRATADGVPLVLAEPSRIVQRVLRITEADLVLPVYASVERAVRHQQRSPSV